MLLQRSAKAFGLFCVTVLLYASAVAGESVAVKTMVLTDDIKSNTNF
ncbi:MAG: hypothetical protein FWE44_03650 [Defluviitaleaceae bacterium]|nr:hypothetical protein [Defluviitaleaceae bacterium]